jgi:hypothetical protein
VGIAKANTKLFTIILKAFVGDCFNFWNDGPTYEWEIDQPVSGVNMYHKYIPDNLAFVEKLARSRGLV